MLTKKVDVILKENFLNLNVCWDLKLKLIFKILETYPFFHEQPCVGWNMSFNGKSGVYAFPFFRALWANMTMKMIYNFEVLLSLCNLQRVYFSRSDSIWPPQKNMAIDIYIPIFHYKSNFTPQGLLIGEFCEFWMLFSITAPQKPWK